MRLCPTCRGTGKVPDDFGAELRRKRKALGMSQVEVGERCGVTGTQISDIELGKRNPGARLRTALMKLLDL